MPNPDVMPQSSETIAAIATAPGKGGVGVIRVSGRGLAPFAQALCGISPRARYAHFARFRDASGVTLDEGLLLFFPAPHSFTGEDVVELQGHGGVAVLQLLLNRCLELGARLAEPGEFTRRAFVNGKLDLAQAESVADLIEASSAAAARSALRSLSGAFSKAVGDIKDLLVDLRMLIEATLDFPEEEIDLLESAHVRERLAGLTAALTHLLDQATQGALLRRGLNVVLAGAPNVGKSSILNALAGEERAIVTDIAGTTRDTLREAIHLEGIPLHIIDTAGLRETADVIEKIGIGRTWQALETADVLILISAPDASELPQAFLQRLPEGIPRIYLHHKIDLLQVPPKKEDVSESEVHVYASAKTGQGIDFLRQALLTIAGWHAHGEDVYLARERHLSALKSALHHVQRAQASGIFLEFLAEELRLAQQQLSLITGEFTPDDLLGEIFSRFCIGK